MIPRYAAAVCAWAILALAGPASAQQEPIQTIASPAPFSINAHLISGPEGVVVVDSLLTADAAAPLVATVRAMNQPVLAILITHTHPDHIGGLLSLTTAFPNASIIASQRTHDDIRDDPGGSIARAASLVPGFGPTVPLPDTIVGAGQSFTIGGLTFEVLEIGAGEAAHMTLYVLPGMSAVFGGDLAGRDSHPWLVEGRSGSWLETIAAVRARLDPALVLHPGHGPTGPLGGLLDEQSLYLNTVRTLVSARVADGVLTPAERDAVVAEMDRRFAYADVVAPLPELRQRNVEAVGAELIAEGGR